MKIIVCNFKKNYYVENREKFPYWQWIEIILLKANSKIDNFILIKELKIVNKF